LENNADLSGGGSYRSPLESGLAGRIAGPTLLFAGALGARLCHSGIVWAEEALPLAAAAQMERGRTLYSEIWFDKPPLLPAVYLLWGAQDGWPMRLGGAVYVLICCALVYRFARDLWGAAEARWAASLLAFFLTFGFASAVIPLAADLLMVAPHIAAVYLAWRGRPFYGGVAAGIAFGVHTKGLFVLAACAIWSWRSLPLLAAGFAVPVAAMAAVFPVAGYWEQVWRWGRLYAEAALVDLPGAARRMAGWAGFQAALLLGSAWFWRREKNRIQFGLWIAISLASVALGWRFFPRYFFHLLPVMVLIAARGLAVAPKAARVAILALLAVPLARFGPRYAQLAVGSDPEWADTAMDRDSRRVAALARSVARPGDTLLVWGFRPELYLYTGLPAGTKFLDSQPLTGVPADRHLTESTSLIPHWAAANRRRLVEEAPTLILDGLGAYNPALAIEAYSDLRQWLSYYDLVGRSGMTIVYRRRVLPVLSSTIQQDK
jgi:hypothetical protein